MLNNFEESLTDIEKVNYYNDKINTNILICRIRLIMYAIILTISFLFASNNNDNPIYKYIFYALITTYIIWWVITFISRNKYIDKMLKVAKNNSFVLCDKCKKYKYSDKECDTCGNDKVLAKEDKIKLINNYENTKKTISFTRSIITVLIIIAEIVAITVFVIIPSNLQTNYSTHYLVTWVYYAFLIIISIIVTSFVLFFFVNTSSYIIKKYVIKIELLNDESITK